MSEKWTHIACDVFTKDGLHVKRKVAMASTAQDAAQIAHEHNTREALVEALERAADVLSGYPATSTACDEAANDARAALAAAKEAPR